jgi:hypothetical protein
MRLKPLALLGFEASQPELELFGQKCEKYVLMMKV